MSLKLRWPCRAPHLAAARRDRVSEKLDLSRRAAALAPDDGLWYPPLPSCLPNTVPFSQPPSPPRSNLLQVAIVTGGDSGIGRSVALLLAKEGAKGIAIVHTPKEQKVGASSSGWTVAAAAPAAVG